MDTNGSPPERRLSRFLVEYLGNLSVEDGAERRLNHDGRELVDWLKREMGNRHLSQEKAMELLSRVREAIRNGDIAVPAHLAEEVNRE